MPRKKKKHEAHVNHERWLVSYADFITLLFAFFVVLFASSQVSHRKIAQLAEAIQTAFQQLGIFPEAYRQPPLAADGSLPTSRMRLITSHVAPEQMFAAMTAAAKAEHERRSLAALRKELDRDLAPEIRRNVVSIEQNREGLIISLREIGFYPSGSATLKPSSLPAVRKIAMVLLHRTENIRFEEHTDNVPIHNAHYASNWELSVARATRMLRLFVTRFDFQPARLSAAGYAQYHPIASNATAAGRALNRRVDIVVLAPRSPLPVLTVTAASTPKRAPPSTLQPAAHATKGATAGTSLSADGGDSSSAAPLEKSGATLPAAKQEKSASKTAAQRK
jgi:chemotaxis protein MotB